MIQVIKNLETISTSYAVFEKDQMLTDIHLNSITQYFEDQTRLTRVKLLGVGVSCGLRCSIQSNIIKATKGFGVTTDGDLLFLNTDTLFDKFKVYDETNPVYAPFYNSGTIIPLYELVPQGTTDARATLLTQFTIKTGRSFNNLAVVFYMESYLKDSDLCTSTDCDNLGKDFKNNIKLLLVEKSNIGLLKQSIQTPDLAADTLNLVTIDRPLFNTSVTAPTQLAQLYRTACNNINANLQRELAKIFTNCSFFINDIFPADPYTAWAAKLNSFNSTYASSDPGIQYYYGFLKDITETYNNFRDLLFDDTTWPSPDAGTFSKHLLIGNLIATADADENRMPFYPSPITSSTLENIRHAKFLLQKLNTLINAFLVPVLSAPDIRITPGKSEQYCLEERPIPYYYKIDSGNPVHQFWSYKLHVRKMDAYNYSYNAPLYSAQGGAANPLGTQINKYDFFRIEGHLGQNITTVHTDLDNRIKTQNLPFALRSIFLGTDRTKIIIKPPIRYTDMHRFHYLLRQDAFYQMDEVKQFSSTFKQKVTDAIASKDVNNTTDSTDGAPVSDIIEQKNNSINSSAEMVRTKMNRSYTQYQQDPSWKTDLGSTIKTGGEYKQNLGKVVKTDFTTPFDTLISNTHLQWIDWIDNIIKTKDDKEDDKLLFPNFMNLHSGMEFSGGAYLGGTFVLVYDINNKVIADFTLPYYAPETAQEQDNEPTLAKPPIRDNWVIWNGIKIQQSIDNKMGFLKNDIIKNNIDVLDNDWKLKFDVQQKDYFTAIKDSYNLMGNVVTGKKIDLPNAAGMTYTDPKVNEMVNQSKTLKETVDYYTNKSKDPSLPVETQKIYEDKAKDAQMELATSIGDTTSYIASAGKDVSTGSEGFTALMELNQGLGAIKDSSALTKVKGTFSNVQQSAGASSPIGLIIGSMMH